MFIEIIIALLLGILVGIFTGLTPGIHINLVALVVLSSSPFLLNYTSPINLTIFIIAVAVTHTFLDSIPSIFLGAPDASTVLSVLPGHKLLLKGLGYEAVTLTVIGSLLAVIISVIMAPALIPLAKIGYPLIKDWIPYILIAASFILIIREKKSIFWSSITYFLAGVLGLVTFNLPLEQPLFPLLSGLFGTSILTVSLMQKTKIPKQKITEVKIKNKEVAVSLTSGFFASSLCGFLPGIGSSEAAILASSPIKKITPRNFLVLIGSINTIVMIISFIALYSIDKARNGAVVVISKILESFNLEYLILFLGASLVVAGIATILTLKLTKLFSNVISKVNYQKLCLAIIILITILAIVLTGFLGLLVLIIATATGLIPQLKGIGKNHLMGCLILPVILYFLL